MEVPEEHWVRLTSFIFEEVVAFWWESALGTNFVGREFNTITWLKFIEVFNVKYYLEQLKEQIAMEFSNFKQGDMIVHDYEQTFNQLERFASTMCSSEKARANKFIWVLMFALKDRVVNERPQTLAQVVEIACLSEEVLKEQLDLSRRMRAKLQWQQQQESQ